MTRRSQQVWQLARGRGGMHLFVRAIYRRSQGKGEEVRVVVLPALSTDPALLVI